MKRTLIHTLWVAALLLPLAAFAAGSKDAGATTATQDAVTIATRDNYPGVVLQDFSVAYMEKQTGTKLTFIRMLPDELEEKLNLLLASGERPEVVQFYSDDFEYKLVDADLLLPLNDLLNTKMPNLKKQWGETLWKAMTHASDGKIYAIPAERLGTYVHFVTQYRQDWLTKLGLKVPTTVDEYYQVAVAMTKNDPDGNNKNDTYAFSGILGYQGTRYFDHIFSAYGTHYWQWLDVDGKIVNGTTLPAAKEALKMMRRLYEAGVIDPEFITDDEQRSIQKWVKGMYGAPNNYVHIFDTTNKYYAQFTENNPNGKWVQATAPLTSSYTGKPLGQRMLGLRGWLKTALVKGSKNPEAAARVLDWYATDEGTRFYNYGIPGEDFELLADGKIKTITPATQWQARSVQQLWLIGREELTWTAPEAYLKAIALSQIGQVPSADQGLIVPERAKYEADLRIFANEQFLKMTVGEIPIDEGFAKFLQEWNARGGKELTDALNRKAGR